ncbi:MAG: ZPR1 zinc finger domain-containing protein [Candidatus Diapherotrites archaeon]|uniref:ZPR1 zinc finger domain-containing protein n=1 Tax=Candidatus Iainarchaeum sp. TaxID=3101447 RepID=A0A8T4C771_9ARCH|nr:ZPR1 zinc finger domain-containing protein [Candidatus Diapherotrites archaeon]
MSGKKAVSDSDNYYTVQTSCPQCEKSATIVQVPETVPLFGQILLQTIVCTHCGFKWSDVMSVEVREPSGYEVHIKHERDLSTKLIRNSSGTVEIPELGVLLEPGALSEGFFTNMEGLLERVENVLSMLIRSNAGVTRKNAEEVMEKLLLCKAGKLPFTVRVLDPYGGSALIGENVKRFKLTKEQLAKLKKGVSFV